MRISYFRIVELFTKDGEQLNNDLTKVTRLTSTSFEPEVESLRLLAGEKRSC